MTWRFAAVALAACLAFAAFTASAASLPAAGCSLTGPFGAGRNQVFLLRPSAMPRSVVVFAHGWTAVDPSDWHRVRFDHLCEAGSIVVFPRYQRDEYDTWQGSVDGFRRGVQIAFGRLGDERRLPVVAAGYSLGGAFVNYYAGNARAWHVPVPRSVLSIFPTERVQGRSAGTPPASVRFLILAGDRDEVVGTRGAKDFWAWLKRHPAARRKYVLIRSTAALTATHEAPKQMTAASTLTFWQPIDVLVNQARRAG
jgi:acetyl esterase/lipase